MNAETRRNIIDLKWADLSSAPPRHGELTPPAPQNDVNAVEVWLTARASRSRSTFERYKLQAERFLTFLNQRNETFGTISADTVTEYEQLLLTGGSDLKPKGPRYVDNVFAVLRSLFKILGQIGYLYGNPLVFRRCLADPLDISVSTKKFLNHEQRLILVDLAVAITATAQGNRASEKAKRTQFVLTWILSTGARISEVLHARMGDIGVDKENAWVWNLDRKGGRNAKIPLSCDAINILSAYCEVRRNARSFPDRAFDDSYIVQSLRGKSNRPMDRSVISRDLKQLFQQASTRIDDFRQSSHIKNTTPQRLRHTAAMQMLDRGATFAEVQSLLGHNEISYTSRRYDYLDPDEFRRELEKGRKFYAKAF